MRHVLLAVVALVAVACTGGGLTVQPGPTEPPFAFPTDTPYSGPAAGTWTGTITFDGTVDSSKHDAGDNGQDPNSSYYATFDKTEAQTADATDTFQVTGADGDLTYGIHSVDLTGTAANQGSADYHSRETGHARSANCQWDYETVAEHVGSWTGDGGAIGEIRFSEDGGYTIDMRADHTGPDGYEKDAAQFPWHETTTISNLTGGCEQTEDSEHTMDVPPPIEWVSSHRSDADVDGRYVILEGQLNAGNPGSVVDGSSTWDMNVPEGFQMTITWHLVHSSPIVLPHS